MTRWLPGALVLTLGTCATARQDEPARAGTEPEGISEHAWVVFGSDTVRAEVARTEGQHERGLMFRTAVPQGTGMLFVFPTTEVRGLWMKDTFVPLDAAFLDESFTVLGVEALEPRDLTVRYSSGPVRYVLEVPRGWFAEHGVTPGDRGSFELEGG